MARTSHADWLCLAFLGLLLVHLGVSEARHLATYKAVAQRENHDFDYFMLVRQWPGNYCSKHACPLLHDHGFHFTIHGLWPNYNDGSYPQFCDNSYKFDEDKISDLEDELEDEWPSFMGDDPSFWDHEWSKHGTCSLSVLPSEHNYFKTILQLHQRYDLAAALRQADILPSRDTVYKNSELVDAIEHMYGARPLVHCYDKALSEVWMCLDRELRPFDCPQHESNTCTELTIPPLQSSGSDSDSVSLPATGAAAATEQLRQGNGLAAGGANDAAGGSADDATRAQRSSAAEVPGLGVAGRQGGFLGPLLSALAIFRAEIAAREVAEEVEGSAAAAAAAAAGTAVAAVDSAAHLFGDAYGDDEDDDSDLYISAGEGDMYDTYGDGGGYDDAGTAADDSVFSLALEAALADHMLRGVAAAAAAAGAVVGAEASAAEAAAADTTARDTSAGGYTFADRDISLYSYDDEVAALGEEEETDSGVGSTGAESAVALLAALDAADAATYLLDGNRGAASFAADPGAALAAQAAAWREARLRAVADGALALAASVAEAMDALRAALALSRAAEAAAEAATEEAAGLAPNGGAAAGLAGSRGFVWSSRLRGAGPAFNAEAAGGAEGGVAVLSDGDGHAMWAVRGVVLVRSGAAAAPGEGERGGGAGEGVAPRGGGGGGGGPVLSWLLAAQLACVAVIAVSLTLLLGTALTAAFVGQRRRRQGGGAKQGLAEPLLAGAGASKLAAGGKGVGWCGAGAGVVVAANEVAAAGAAEAATLRPGLLAEADSAQPLRRQ